MRNTHSPCRCVNDRNNNYRFSYAPPSPILFIPSDDYWLVPRGENIEILRLPGFLATHFSPARVNCNREYARATDPCGSLHRRIRDTRDWNRVMNFHVAVTGMKIPGIVLLHFVLQWEPRLIIVVSLFKSFSCPLFRDNLLQKSFWWYLENSFLFFSYFFFF